MYTTLDKKHAMRETTAIIAMAAMTIPLLSQATPACDKPIFYCELQKSTKAVQVCEQASGHLRYSYGPIQGKPELVFSVQQQHAEITPWSGVGWSGVGWGGVGSLYWASLEMPNGVWRYRMSVIYPRNGAPESDSATLAVSKNDQEQRHWLCNPSSLQERIESLQP